MRDNRNTDRAAIKVEIDRLRHIEGKVDSSIGQGVTRRILELELRLEQIVFPPVVILDDQLVAGGHR